MIFDEIEIQGDPNVLAANPPDVCIEVMDFDTFVSIITGWKVKLKPKFMANGQSAHVSFLRVLVRLHNSELSISTENDSRMVGMPISFMCAWVKFVICKSS